MTSKQTTHPFLADATCYRCRRQKTGLDDCYPIISFVGGYGSCFDDESLVYGEFCRRCLMQRIGPYFHRFDSTVGLDVENPLGCDRCRNNIGLDDIEGQEFIAFRLPTPDEDRERFGPFIESIICQHCAKTCLGEFLKIRWMEESPFRFKEPVPQPIWAWQKYQLAQGWRDAEYLLQNL